MRIAYHISVHSKPNQFKWLFDAIYNSEDIFAVHVDKKTPKSDADAFVEIVGDKPNVHFNQNRSVIYGDWALCEVELDGIMLFLEHSADWDYFVNLSGQDYPVKSRSQIVSELSSDPTQNYVNLIPLSKLPKYFERRKKWYCFRLGDRLIRTPIPYAQPKHIQVDWHGSAWHILTREFCQWVVSAPESKECMSFLRHVKLSNEFLMQTLIMNGPFRSTLNRAYRRKMIWKDHSPHPEILTIKDYRKLVDSDAFFARKFDADLDKEVLHALAQHIGIRPVLGRDSATH